MEDKFYKYDEITELNKDNFKDIIDNCTNNYMINSRDRPYDGQPHTDQGIRGKEIVKGLTMRDIVDCIVKGILSSSTKDSIYSTVSEDTWQYRDIYAAGDYDPMAAIQNATCYMEEMMINDGNMKPYWDRHEKYMEEHIKEFGGIK